MIVTEKGIGGSLNQQEEETCKGPEEGKRRRRHPCFFPHKPEELGEIDAAPRKLAGGLARFPEKLYLFPLRG